MQALASIVREFSQQTQVQQSSKDIVNVFDHLFTFEFLPPLQANAPSLQHKALIIVTDFRNRALIMALRGDQEVHGIKLQLSCKAASPKQRLMPVLLHAPFLACNLLTRCQYL